MRDAAASVTGDTRHYRSNRAFTATTTIERLMSAAPTAGRRMRPAPASTPAAGGTATMS